MGVVLCSMPVQVTVDRTHTPVFAHHRHYEAAALPSYMVRHNGRACDADAVDAVRERGWGGVRAVAVAVHDRQEGCDTRA